MTKEKKVKKQTMPFPSQSKDAKKTEKYDRKDKKYWETIESYRTKANRLHHDMIKKTS